MSALRKTMVYLGLAEDQRRYEDDDIDQGYDEYDEAYHHAEVTELAPRRQVAEVVRSAPSAGISRITTIHPRTYNEAKTIGESFRDNVPVIMNLTDMDDADAKRLVDFAAGLVVGLHGSIERVTAKVFLLSPENVSVTAEDKARMVEGSFFNQS